MKTSAYGRALIKAFEGLFLKTYKDPVGVLTIGYGHTNLAGVPPPVRPGDTITIEQADAILADDLVAVEKSVERCITVPLTQYEFDALVSFELNTGALRRGSIDEKINAGRKADAMSTLLLYNKAGGKVLSGLIRRRGAEKLLFEGNVSAALERAKSPKKSVVKKETVWTRLQSFLNSISR